MKLTLYQVDAFTTKLFKGNPAAVVPLDKWLDESTMQMLAMENNLSETVFFVPSADGSAHYDIRWFTPEREINLCGHATLASAYVLYRQLSKRGGELHVQQLDERVLMSGHCVCYMKGEVLLNLQ